jgi:hypothetical protein
MGYKRVFQVANPSDTARSDYVEVLLSAVDVPDTLDERSLRLSRLRGDRRIPLPHQVDRLVGTTRERMLSFFSEATPPGPDDYSRPSDATFLLEETSGDIPFESEIQIDHYYLPRRSGDDGYRPSWEPDRDAYAVKLRSSTLEVYVSLIGDLGNPAIDYAGAATSVRHLRAHNDARAGEMLKPFGGEGEATARWGQLTGLDFYPLPWEPRFYHRLLLIGSPEQPHRYHLIWSSAGPVRATVVLRSDPFTLRYGGGPYFHPRTLILTAHLYRVISLYPQMECYTERLLVRTAEGESIGFRPHFQSFIEMPAMANVRPARFETVPDYFAVWRNFHEYQHHGYGFAADSHIRALKMGPSEIRWRLDLGHNHKCVHYFMFEGTPHAALDPFRIIGHSGWYEQLFKPLEVFPPKRFLASEAATGDALR